MKQKIFSLLALLMAAVSGAWASQSTVKWQEWLTSDGQPVIVESKVQDIATWMGNAESPWADPNVAFDDKNKNYLICAWSREKGRKLNDDGGWDPFPADITVDPDDPSNHVFVCHGQAATSDGDASVWDNQFWIQSPKSWKYGDKIKIHFRYKASQNAKTNTQIHKQAPSDYLSYEAIGDIEFTTMWKEYDGILTISDKNAGGWSIAFNLNAEVKDAVDFYFDDLSWQTMDVDYAFTEAKSDRGSGTVKFFIGDNEVFGAKVGDEGKDVTMTVTPDDGWAVDVDNVIAQAYTTWEAAGARRRTGTPDDGITILGDVPLTKSTTAENTWTFKVPAASVLVTPAYKKSSTLTFNPADKTNLMTITTKVGEADATTATPDQEGKLTNVLEGTAVKLKAKQPGYKFRTVEVKKDANNTVDVNANANPAGATFTEATFTMPAFDATATYDLVRDMTYNVAFSGLPAKALVKKDGQGKFQLDDADALNFQLLDNINANNPKDITNSTDITYTIGKMVEYDEFPGYYYFDETTEVSIDVFKADAQPGLYVINAKANDTGDYDGAISSNMIKIYNGYEVIVPVGEYITYYKDEALTLDAESGAQLYTITAVDGNESTATVTPMDVAPAYTPMLVYNSSNVTTKILLIPTTTNANVSHYSGFNGVLEPTTLAGDYGFYAFNGKQFVYVKEDLLLPANKCCLKIIHSDLEQGARAITLVFGDGNATGLKAIDNGQLIMDNGEWYDLSGRKLAKKPTRKGVYIQNGQKVVIK